MIHPRENDLVIGTHGRGIYILDDITPLEKIAEASAAGPAYLFPAKPVTLYNENGSFPGGRGAAAEGERTFAAPNPPYGSMLTYYIRDSIPRGQQVSLAIYDSTGKKVRDLTASAKQGMHRLTWDLRLAAPYSAPRGTPAFRQPRGSFVLPGRYTARLSVGGRSGAPSTTRETSIEVRPDPLVSLSAAEYRDLHTMRVRAGQAQANVQAAVRSGEQVKQQIAEAKTALRNATGSDALSTEASALERDVDDILAKLRGRQDSTGGSNDVDDKSRSEPSIQDRVDQVAEDIGGVTSPPTQLQRETITLAIADLQRESAKLNTIITTRIPPFFQKLDAAGVPWSLGRPVQIIK